MAVNPLGAVQLLDFGNPKTITMFVRENFETLGTRETKTQNHRTKTFGNHNTKS